MKTGEQRAHAPAHSETLVAAGGAGEPFQRSVTAPRSKPSSVHATETEGGSPPKLTAPSGPSPTPSVNLATPMVIGTCLLHFDRLQPLPLTNTLE